MCKGINKKSSVIFENVGVGKRMYMAAASAHGKLKPVSNAFSTDTSGNIIYYKPDFTNTFTNSFARKFTGWGAYNLRRVALIGGEFFISDSPDFSNEKSIYKITDTLNYYLNIIDIEDQKGKYLRYKFPNTQDSVFDGPAEVVFYSSGNKGIQKLEGRYFGSPQLSKKHISLLTDEDILTYLEVWKCDEDVDQEVSNFVFKTENQPLWMGMELDEETTVSHVGICPRNDKNGVYAGMRYELFYWDNAWKSLGEKVAAGDSISFDNIPQNSVLWLRNLDEGREERIFTLDDGEQKWW